MPVNFFPLNEFDLAQLASEAGGEGCAVLAGGNRVIVGIRPIRETNEIPSEGAETFPRLQKGICVIGCLAYPNVGLKNTIPSARFYSYEFIQNSKIQKFKNSKLSQGQSTFRVGKFKANISKKTYFQKIEKIKEYLTAGEVYQINFAIRFTAPFSGDPYGLFLALQQKNPADFSAYFNGGDFQIVSCSPERLFQMKNGIIRTQPIKGTAPKELKIKNQEIRIKDLRQSASLERLLGSEKERAELDMITDLERNDLGKICEYGSVRVKKERAILELPNLWHTYSEIQGRLREDVSTHEIFDALFPGGSVTGCPKIRAMRFISELEGAPRNIFTGAIGYMASDERRETSDERRETSDERRETSDERRETSSERRETSSERRVARDEEERKLVTGHSSLDFNIAIRTALIQDGRIEFWAGGGIVMDSDPEREYLECLLKAERILDTIGQG
ncbi:anthranilate synthase component I family protein [Candidatus Peregrinibacteria bacterium]|nr:anthranilate synthase component I family protein [Candidatus Peregrinibacteria bacterium]